MNSPEIKQCQDCGEFKYKSQFHKRKNVKCGVRSYCKLCEYKHLKKHREEHPEQTHKTRFRNSLRYRYQLTESDYLKLVSQSNNTCYICKESEMAVTKKGNLRMLSIDHDHITGEVRGLLCYRCNAGLGYFRDNPDLLQKAGEYLNNYNLFYAKKRIG